MKTVARPKRPPAENLAVAVDVRMLRGLETFLRRLADPRRTDFSFATVVRHQRALETLLAEHVIRRERELVRAVRSASVAAERLQRQVFRLEQAAEKAPDRATAPARLEAVR